MDRITKSLLGEFVLENCLELLPEDKAFEHFCGYLLTSNHFSDDFSTDDISVGAGGDCGIDCIAIIVNGCLVTEPEEVNDLAEGNSYVDAAFIFVQAERSSSFEASKIGHFGFGVKDFFSATPSITQNDKVKLACRVANEIFSLSSRFRKGNPQCYLYYATTGRWSEDKDLCARRDAARRDLESLNIFKGVQFECIGADKIQELYQQSKNAVSREILFVTRAVLPELPGVEQAYLGVLPATEFLKLVENENQEIMNAIFYDNVRHWQEWNPVNTGMKETLEDACQRQYFPLLNNGVTVVARQIIPTGNRFVVEDYQVVNGCQTSYVLHETRSMLSEDVFVPVRLIATQDPEIRNAIIKSTNRQTQVTDDQLFALSDFPKKLEAYFPSFRGRKLLHYERRSRQYSTTQGIEKVRVVDMRTLIRAFASIFLEQPHRTTRNYKTLLKSTGNEIFNRDHLLEPYYVAAYAHYRLEFLFRNQVLPAELKPARYHLLLAFRLLVSSDRLPPLNSRALGRKCEVLMEALWDEQRFKTLFEEAADRVREVAAGNLHRDNIRTEPFTDSLLHLLRPTPRATEQVDSGHA